MLKDFDFSRFIPLVFKDGIKFFSIPFFLSVDLLSSFTVFYPVEHVIKVPFHTLGSCNSSRFTGEHPFPIFFFFVYFLCFCFILFFYEFENKHPLSWTYTRCMMILTDPTYWVLTPFGTIIFTKTLLLTRIQFLTFMGRLNLRLQLY